MTGKKQAAHLRDAAVRRAEAERDEARTLVAELTAHLDYCGWGRDAWERERGADLRARVLALAWLTDAEAGL